MEMRIPAAFALLGAALLLAGCTAMDVVGGTSIASFKSLMEVEKGSVALDSARNRWVLTSQGGEKFEWSADFSSDSPDFRLSLDASPFLAAGLDPLKLPQDRYSFDLAEKILTLSFEVGNEKFSYPGSPTPQDTFRKIVETHRPIVSYHAALDQYGISLGDGNTFAWAKDMRKNDKDMVFVLDPGPLVEAGVDPSRVTGWTFTRVPAQDKSGKTMDVDRFVKAYNLE